MIESEDISMTNKIFALIILIIFYGIYFGKKYTQKLKGIKTNQIGSRKEKNLHTIESLMRIATLIIVPVQLISILCELSYLPPNIRIIGFVIGIIGDFIFLCAILTMRDSWRAGIPESDKTKLVTKGIYSWSRNPAFLGFDMMYIGICLLYCNLFTVFFSLFAIIMLHLQILQEEKYMEDTFREEYLSYKEKAARYFGRR